MTVRVPLWAAMLTTVLLVAGLGAHPSPVAAAPEPEAAGATAGAAFQETSALFPVSDSSVENRVISRVTQALSYQYPPAAYQTLELISDAGKTHAVFIDGNRGTGSKSLELPLDSVKSAYHSATRQDLVAVVTGTKDGEQQTYAFTFSPETQVPPQSAVHQIDAWTGKQLVTVSSVNNRLMALIRDADGKAAIESLDLPTDSEGAVSDVNRVDLRLGKALTKNAKASILRGNYEGTLVIADDGLLAASKLSSPNQLTVVDDNVDGVPGTIELMDEIDRDTVEQHIVVSYGKDRIRRFLYRPAEIIWQDRPISIPAELNFGGEQKVPEEISSVTIDPGFAEVVVTSAKSSTLYSYDLLDELKEPRISRLPSGATFVGSPAYAAKRGSDGISLEVNHGGKIYEYRNSVKATPYIGKSSTANDIFTEDKGQFHGNAVMLVPKRSWGWEYSVDGGKNWIDQKTGSQRTADSEQAGLYSHLPKSRCSSTPLPCTTMDVPVTDRFKRLTSTVAEFEAVKLGEREKSAQWRLRITNDVGITYSPVIKPEDVKPEPTETATPEPTETATPEPTETATPEPTETATPEPTETPGDGRGTLFWEINKYSEEWHPLKENGVKKGSTEFSQIFDGGKTESDGSTIRAEWDGSVTYRPYYGSDEIAYPWMKFENPILERTKSGKGSITFEVSWFNGHDKISDGKRRVTVIDFFDSTLEEGADGLCLSAQPEYDGVEYKSPDLTNVETFPSSYPKDYVDWLAPEIRPWWYATGSGLDENKRPNPIRACFESEEQPTQTPEPTDPGTSPEPTDPGTSPEPTDPGTSPEPTDPGTSPEPTDPGTSPEPTDPGTSPEPTDPGTSPEPTDPGTSPEPTDPGKSPEPTDPGTSPEPTDPGKSPEPTDPGTSPEPTEFQPDGSSNPSGGGSNGGSTNPSGGKSDLPRTGAAGSPLLYGSIAGILLLVGSLALISARRRAQS